MIPKQKQDCDVTTITGKAYDVVSFASQNSEATVFSSSASKTKIGKFHIFTYECMICRYVLCGYSSLTVLRIYYSGKFLA